MRRSLLLQAIQEEENNIDLTPMLDVVFIILIFFIVTASLVKEKSIEVNRPETTTAVKKNNSNIIIAINGSNEIWADKRRIDVRSVRAFIERMQAKNPEVTVVVRADKDATVATLTAVVDSARAAGIYDVFIATKDR